MGDHGLWNRGNFSFNGKYPEFSSLKVLACGRVTRWKPERCGGRSSAGKRAEGRLVGLATSGMLERLPRPGPSVVTAWAVRW